MNAASLFMEQSLAHNVFTHRPSASRTETLELTRPHALPERYLFGSGDSYEVQVAASIEDRVDAWRLVYEEYLKKGYADTDPRGLWYGSFDALPDTTTFLARKDGQPVGTLTIVFDGPMGLPADALYGRELNRMRNQGRRLCEIISLAHGEKSQSLLVLKHMFKLAYITARHIEMATDFIITCTPGHGSFYERQLLFKKVGREQAYGKVNGTVGIMMDLELADAEERYRARFDRPNKRRNMYKFFTSRIPELVEWVRACRGPLDEASIVKYFIDDPNPSGTPSQRELLRLITADSLLRNTEFGISRCINL